MFTKKSEDEMVLLMEDSGKTKVFACKKKSRIMILLAFVIITSLILHLFQSRSPPSEASNVISEGPPTSTCSPLNATSLTKNTYIVLSSDLNIYYLAHVPLIIQYWKNMGVGALLMITLTEKEDPEENPAVVKILDYSKKLGAHIEYLRNKTILAGQFAQAARSFAAGTEFSFTLPEDAIFITTDIDFYPSNVTHHVPDLSNGKEMMFYDYNCCGSVKWKGLRYPMYIMITIGMTLKRWREVIELPKNHSIDGTYIDNVVNATFDNSIKNHSMFWYWFLDQRFFGYKMNNFVAPNIEDFNKISSKFAHKDTLPRLEKYYFPSEEEINNMTLLDKYESFHIAPGIVFENNWKKNLPVYRQLYPPDQLEELTIYRNEVAALTNLTDVEARFYHPDQGGGLWKKQYGNNWDTVHKQNWTIHSWKNLEK